MLFKYISVSNPPGLPFFSEILKTGTRSVVIAPNDAHLDFLVSAIEANSSNQNRPAFVLKKTQLTNSHDYLYRPEIAGSRTIRFHDGPLRNTLLNGGVLVIDLRELSAADLIGFNGITGSKPQISFGADDPIDTTNVSLIFVGLPDSVTELGPDFISRSAGNQFVLNTRGRELDVLSESSTDSTDRPASTITFDTDGNLTTSTSTDDIQIAIVKGKPIGQRSNDDLSSSEEPRTIPHISARELDDHSVLVHVGDSGWESVWSTIKMTKGPQKNDSLLDVDMEFDVTPNGLLDLLKKRPSNRIRGCPPRF